MNGDPYRASQPNDRRVINRAGSAAATERSQRQAEELQVKDEAPRTPVRPARATSAPAGGVGDEPRRRRLSAALTIAIAALVVVAVGVFVFMNMKPGAPGINSGRYQAVSFTDGQLYFGKLSDVNSEYMKLTDVYYLQPQTNDGASVEDSLKNATTNQNNFKLIKFTDVIYGPEDEMIIPKNQILFYENIQEKGKVAQLIEQQKGNK